ncbi:MAG: molybdopterin-synthase adenylyltransferase MoeB [Austwickia sp.]|jgi:molybdopterin/thiamine biosynthesis adenylyltransferase/rhodanese-related sulfurtransferase|nr:MAG: molybdopterin-synthase adenylyltransferase MoeB [Austwickia sp.]
MESSTPRSGGIAGGGLTARERERYARHLLLPGVGLAGQERLAAARVLVVGAGGLGSPVLTYLAAAGVGVLGVVDDDIVDVTNLQRQVVHGTADLGRPKVDSAADRIADLNPHVVIERHQVRLSAATAVDLLTPYDVVVDATDNFPARYLLSDACVLVGRPLVWGAVARFDGQVSVWWPSSVGRGRSGPCYRCVFPRPPAPGSVPSCAEGGVLGVLPGVIGTLQATEVLKILLGVGEPLVGRMLVYDALAARVGTVPLAAHPACPSCSPGAEVRLVDLDEACAALDVRGVDEPAVNGTGAPTQPGGESVPQVAPAVAAARLAGPSAPLLVDVREAAEREIVKLPAPEELWVPLGSLRASARLPGVGTDRELLVYCRSGVRSAEAVALLRAAGYVGAVNVAGGLLGWRTEVDAQIPAY